MTGPTPKMAMPPGWELRVGAQLAAVILRAGDLDAITDRLTRLVGWAESWERERDA